MSARVPLLLLAIAAPLVPSVNADLQSCAFAADYSPQLIDNAASAVEVSAPTGACDDLGVPRYELNLDGWAWDVGPTAFKVEVRVLVLADAGDAAAAMTIGADRRECARQDPGELWSPTQAWYCAFEPDTSPEFSLDGQFWLYDNTTWLFSVSMKVTAVWHYRDGTHTGATAQTSAVLPVPEPRRWF